PFCAARKYSGWVDARLRKTFLAAVGSAGVPVFNIVRPDSSPPTKYRLAGCEFLTITMSSVPGASLRTRDHSGSSDARCSVVTNRATSPVTERAIGPFIGVFCSATTGSADALSDVTRASETTDLTFVLRVAPTRVRFGLLVRLREAPPNRLSTVCITY